MGLPDDDDLAFLERFEQCAFGKETWTHEAHIRMAWVRLSVSASFSEALDRIRAGIRRFNQSIGSTGYHETVTIAFTRVIAARLHDRPAADRWPDFLAANPDLLSKDSPVLERYYSPELLAAPISRDRFVEPDLKPLPLISRTL